MKRAIYFGAVCLWIALTAPAHAQSRGNTSARNQLIDSFQRSAPRVDEVLPDVEVYDAAGARFKLSTLRGEYTVLVFGCLT